MEYATIIISIITTIIAILFIFQVKTEADKSFEEIRKINDISKNIKSGLNSNDKKYEVLKNLIEQEKVLKEKKKEELKKMGFFNTSSIPKQKFSAKI